MPEREKVIKGLECCSKGCSGGCPYSVEGGDCCTALAADALELLKAQEPVEPKREMIEFFDGLTGQKFEVPTCGICGTLVGDALYCPQCGRKVLWND